MSFDMTFESFLKEQIRGASGQREEMVRRELTGTKLLVKNLLLPVFGKLDGVELEYEMNGLSGVKIYGDAVNGSLRTVFEEEHYFTHAERITRDRFSFERARRPERCRTWVYLFSL